MDDITSISTYVSVTFHFTNQPDQRSYRWSAWGLGFRHTSSTHLTRFRHDNSKPCEYAACKPVWGNVPVRRDHARSPSPYRSSPLSLFQTAPRQLPLTSQNTGPLRSSGHKEATVEHETVSALKTRGDNGDPEQLLQNRILNNSQVSRASLYDHDDFLTVASSTKQFDLEADDVRKVSAAHGRARSLVIPGPGESEPMRSVSRPGQRRLRSR